jgi:hypothetical protein
LDWISHPHATSRLSIKDRALSSGWKANSLIFQLMRDIACDANGGRARIGNFSAEMTNRSAMTELFDSTPDLR